MVLYEDKTAFNDLDFAVSSSDPNTVQDFKNKASVSLANAGVDFGKMRQALNDHFDQAKQEVSPRN